MRKCVFTLLMSTLALVGSGQSWSTTRLADMPMRITNNSVVEGYLSNGDTCVYSFGGIDSTLIWSGITRKAFRYNISNNTWDTIPSLPDTLGKIASYASRVHDTIYIIGGYHVFQNGNESSSNKVHRYVTTTNSYLTDGANIPVPIDDHVQAVWRDSLIYVITGWSNTGNVPNVQIYDPSQNSWQAGTPVPNNNQYMAFGASGVITGDTIYYYGGASMGSNFPATNIIRKGVIDPLNPANITWSLNPPWSMLNGYRTTSVVDFAGWIHWIGGSELSYNYDGLAYDGSGPVNLSSDIRLLIPTQPQAGFTDTIDPLPMDLRGSANVTNPLLVWNRIILAGGMWSNQEVSNQTLLLDWVQLFSVEEQNYSYPFVIYPNPAGAALTIEFTNALTDEIYIEIVDLQGRVVLTQQVTSQQQVINTSSLASGTYVLMCHYGSGVVPRRIVIEH